MKFNLFFYLLMLLPIVSEGQATKNTNYNNLVWMNDYLKIKLNEKWGFYFDASYRTTDWLNHWIQVKLNPGIVYQVNTKINATAGFAYFISYTPLHFGSGIQAMGAIAIQSCDISRTIYESSCSSGAKMESKSGERKINS